MKAGLLSLLVLLAAGSAVAMARARMRSARDTRFSGIIEAIDLGCWSDGRCFMTVSGNQVTFGMGWSRSVWGDVRGLDLQKSEELIGQKVEVFARCYDEKSFTLEGSKDYHVRPAVPGGHLAWEFSPAVKAAHGGEVRFPVAVSLTGPDWEVLWKTPLPGWIVGDSVEKYLVSNHELHPASEPRFIVGTLFLENAVVVGHPLGVLILSRRDGKVLLDLPSPPAPHEGFFYFDDGDCEVVPPVGSPVSAPAGSGRCLVRVGDAAVFFARGWAVAVGGSPPRVLHETYYEHARHRIEWKGPGTHAADIPLGPYLLRLRGVVHLR